MNGALPPALYPLFPFIDPWEIEMARSKVTKTQQFLYSGDYTLMNVLL